MCPQSVKRKSWTPEQALASLMRLCARAEKSSSDALRLMSGRGLSSADREKVLRKLVDERFIDDSRYAEAFVREKSSLDGWGEYKIRAALQRKGIDRETVDAALASADRGHSLKMLRQRLARKLRTVRAASDYELKNKLIRYGLSLGFDMDTVRSEVGLIVKNSDEECDFFL